MAMKFSRKKNVNAMRISIKVAVTVIGLYAGGFLLTVFGNVINGTSSPYYIGLKLIGYTVGTVANTTDSTSCAIHSCTGASCDPTYHCVTSTDGTGILSIIGLLAIVWIVFEFIDIKAY